MSTKKHAIEVCLKHPDSKPSGKDEQLEYHDILDFYLEGVHKYCV